MTLPSLPAGISGINLYLSDATAQSGTAVLYASGIATSTYLLTNQPPTGGLARPIDNDPAASGAPVVNPTGGNLAGLNCASQPTMVGTLAAGRYFVLFTFVYPSGVETFAGQASAVFTVNPHDIPLVTLPPLPAGATGYNIYLSDAEGDPGTATRYATNVTTTTLYLLGAAPVGGAPAPIYNSATLAPEVNPIGGNSYGGKLLPGTYFVQFTFTYPNGAETSPSPASTTFAVVAGNVPPGRAPAAARRRDRGEHLPLGPPRPCRFGDPLRLGGHHPPPSTYRPTPWPA